MKIYIAGKITGLSKKAYSANFLAGVSLISQLGMSPVNPLENGLPVTATWEEHMKADIALLLECEGAYFQKNWSLSRGARIEHKIAEETGKIILYEDSKFTRRVLQAEAAVQYATGLRLSNYRKKSRSTPLFYARVLFANLCMSHSDRATIADLLDRSELTIRKYETDFLEESRYNPRFRRLAEKVASFITQS